MNYFMPGDAGRRSRVQDRRLLARQLQLRPTHTAATRSRASRRRPSCNRTTAATVADRLPGAADARRPDRSTTCSTSRSTAQDTITHGPADAAARPPLRPQPRSGAGISGCGQPAHADAAAGGELRGRRPGRHLQQLLAAPRPHLRPQGDGKTIVRANYATYYGQVGTGGVASQVNPVTRVSVRYPWVDANHDKFVQANEVSMANVATPLGVDRQLGSGSNPGSPTTVEHDRSEPQERSRPTSSSSALDREIGAGFAVGANYIWRRYSNFQFVDTLGLDRRRDFAPVDVHADGQQPARRRSVRTARRSATTSRTFQCRRSRTLTNFTSSQYNRAFNGFELTGRKRMSHHWLMNTSFAYNSTIVNMNGCAGDSANASIGARSCEDPTNRGTRNGYQYDYLTAGSGIGNVYVNAKWLFKLSGLYQLPWRLQRVGVLQRAAGLSVRASSRPAPTRANGAGTADGAARSGRRQPPAELPESRLPRRASDQARNRPVRAGARHLQRVQLNTIQAVRATQNATNANHIQAAVAPRVLRFGIRLNW